MKCVACEEARETRADTCLSAPRHTLEWCRAAPARPDLEEKKQQTLSSADVETGRVIIRNRPLGFSEWWHRTVGRQTLLQVDLSHMYVNSTWQESLDSSSLSRHIRPWYVKEVFMSVFFIKYEVIRRPTVICRVWLVCAWYFLCRSSACYGLSVVMLRFVILLAQRLSSPVVECSIHVLVVASSNIESKKIFFEQKKTDSPLVVWL